VPENNSNPVLAKSPAALTLGFGILALLLVVFWDGLALMASWWEREEYNHGYLIPLVALYLLWLRADDLRNADLKGSWTGLIFIAGGLFGLVLGELSSIYTIIQYAFLLTLFGVIVACIGWRGFRIVWVPFVYLIFMIPLPNFLYFNLSSELQLISSQLGVAVIRLFGISVFLEGNVIDLGIYQLQVAEACNGLRYLFPLMSFGFLLGALYNGPWWHRAIIFLSSIPLTIFMNSFRIGVIGVLVENFGIEQAEGFLHYFEGWIVFMACVALMFLIMAILARLQGQKLMQVFALDVPPTEHLAYLLPRKVNPQFIASLAALGLGLVIAFSLQTRQDLIPERDDFSTFPLRIADWRGRDQFVEQVYLNTLKTDDYLMADFNRSSDPGPVNLWVAYYANQRKGRSVHSPKACLPGGGWRMESLKNHRIPDVGPDGKGMTVNRAVIAKGDSVQVVYYWFVERGRIQTNEYMVKWYIFWDALTRNRTDGALVRLTTFVGDRANLPEADARLEAFAQAIDPQLTYYLPQWDATFEDGDSRFAALGTE
jgi:exosortase D (VPLPA-CTERM-specific)